MVKSTAPQEATQIDDEELPQTAVKLRGKDLLIQQMRDQLDQNKPNETTAEEPKVTSPEEATWSKRYSDLRRYSQQKENKFNAEVAELKTQLTQLQEASNRPMPKTIEEFEAWKAQYPDIVGFIEIIADQKAGEARKQLQEELGSVREKLGETEKEKAYATLHVLVPDLDTVLKTPEYSTWFSDQPQFIQDVLNNSDDPHQIAYYLNVYKLTTAPATPKTKNKASAVDALDISTKSSGAAPSISTSKYKYTQSQIAKMSSTEYEKNEPDIIAARNAGLILDDVSRHNDVFNI